MNTKYLMIASAVLMGAVGIILTFLPQEILKYAGASPGLHPIFLQITGALYFSFALLNWMAKTNLIGGIYSKPVAMGNFTHFFVGGITLLKGVFAYPDLNFLWIAGGIYSLFAILFGMVAFGVIKTNPGS